LGCFVSKRNWWYKCGKRKF